MCSLFMNKKLFLSSGLKTLSVLAISIGLTACGDRSWWTDDEPKLNAEQIARIIPGRVNDRRSWAEDIYDISEQFGIPQNKENMCSIIAVVDQESNFVADPQVYGLGEKRLKKFKIA